MSPQFSLFYNSKFEDDPSNIYNTKWNTEYYFRNECNGLWVKIGGDQKAGIINYIAWLGFCEGGHPKNGYRVDPIVVNAVLRGKVCQKAVEIWRERLQSNAGEQVVKVEAITKEIA